MSSSSASAGSGAAVPVKAGTRRTGSASEKSVLPGSAVVSVNCTRNGRGVVGRIEAARGGHARVRNGSPRVSSELPVAARAQEEFVVEHRERNRHMSSCAGLAGMGGGSGDGEASA